MSLAGRQLIAMILLVTLPLSVGTLTAIGLWQLDRSLDSVSEEYAELRVVQGIDRDLSAAAIALASEDPKLRASAREFLKSAESALVQYLATQYDDVASAEHQAIESSSASSILSRLQDILASDLGGADGPRPVEQVAELRRNLDALQRTADAGVQSAHQAADRSRRSTLWRVIGASLISTLACIGLVAWTMRSVNRRLRDLHQRLTAHAPGEVPTPAKGLGEVVTQIEGINARMLRKIEESGRELLRRERMVGIGMLAAEVAHEINNPMNAILGLSELGLRSVGAGPLSGAGQAELKESLQVVRREALRCKAIIERLMAMVRTDRKPGWFDASRLVEETVQVAKAARPDRASCFHVTGSAVPIRVFASANDVRQVLLILLINAADAVASDGRIEIDAMETGKEVWFRVRDNGRGFTEEMRQTFFTPFSSHREDGTGTGLGLSIAQALTEGMGATLRPFSEGLGTGSLFILAIPVPETSR